jgi:catechol 2,3-dioxygenase-like lactoylglutathione lyase family enzyme
VVPDSAGFTKPPVSPSRDAHQVRPHTWPGALRYRSRRGRCLISNTPGVTEPLLEGPGPPDSVPQPPEHRVSELIPFVHVEDVQRSIDYYHHLGFTLASVYKYRGQPIWAELDSEGAKLMVSTDGDSIDPAGQGILFYLYSKDLAALRQQLLADGIPAGEIEDGTPGPRHEMRLYDPDGYELMVAQIEP